jgi:pimeloyl-ACP methyl ester carboxylesterase
MSSSQPSFKPGPGQHSQPGDLAYEPTRGAKSLLVYVPGLPTKRSPCAELLSRLERDLGQDWRVLCWDSGLRWWSRRPMGEAGHRLRVRLRAEWDDTGGFERIVLVGHSVGGVIVRHAYLLDSGAYADVLGPHEWVGKVERIVLLAALNRGFQISNLPFTQRWLLRMFGGPLRFTVGDLRAGSPFIATLRLLWMQYFDANTVTDPPMVVQLLGDRDGLIGREDSIDIEQFPGAAHLTVPDSGHDDLVDVSSERDSKAGQLRYSGIRRAVMGGVVPTEPTTSPTPRHILFLLHGIRAGREDWAQPLRDKLRAERPDLDVRALSYGYFSALGFALPFTRPRNLRRFLDAYSEAVAEHRGRSFSFAGHSNGTYILGQALQAIPAVRMDQIFLGGSVLPRDFSWRKLLARGQVRRVRNVRAADDWVVAMLCAALRGLMMRDVGTGGYD